MICIVQSCTGRSGRIPVCSLLHMLINAYQRHGVRADGVRVLVINAIVGQSVPSRSIGCSRVAPGSEPGSPRCIHSTSRFLSFPSWPTIGACKSTGELNSECMCESLRAQRPTGTRMHKICLLNLICNHCLRHCARGDSELYCFVEIYCTLFVVRSSLVPETPNTPS